MKPSFELFEHTADLGIRSWGKTLEEAFEQGAQGLMAALLDNPDEVIELGVIEQSIEGDDREYLYFDWLRWLLYQFESKKTVFRSFQVKWEKSGINVRAHGEPLDPNRHQLAHEVKAITYHGLTVDSHHGGWQTECIVDI